MKNNLYKYAALSVIVETLNEKCKDLRDAVQRNTEHYESNHAVIPDWTKADIDRNAAIADFIDDFISKL